MVCVRIDDIELKLSLSIYRCSTTTTVEVAVPAVLTTKLSKSPASVTVRVVFSWAAVIPFVSTQPLSSTFEPTV